MGCLEDSEGWERWATIISISLSHVKLRNIQGGRSKKGEGPVKPYIQVFLYCLLDSSPILEVNDIAGSR